MRILLISILVLFAMQSKASVSDTLTDNGLTEMRINDVVYVGRVTSANDSVITIDVVNVIKVDPNNSTVIYVNSNATKIKKAIITDSREPVISINYNIVSKFNNK